MMARAVPALACLLFLVGPSVAGGQDIASFYDEHCAACHTIGGGAQAGPDLKGITKLRSRDWLVRFLVDPEGLVAGRDPIALQIVAEWGGVVMPSTPGLTPGIAAGLLDHIDHQSAEHPSPAAEPDRPLTEADVARGLALFTGAARLEAGGAACLACHELPGAAAIKGGTLGAALNTSYARLGGTRGLASWLASPPTPMMRALYGRAPLSADERHAVVAVMARAQDRAAATRASGLIPVAGTAAAGLVLAFAALGFAWRKRFRAVRRPLVAAARTPSHVRAGGRR